MSSRLKYMPALDGLRALAVIMVVLFHSRLPWVPGGFVGVDVFFVLSGFLITQIVAKGLDSGSFSYWRFISSRIWRLVPAYLTMLFLVFCCGYFLLLPTELATLSKSLVYATLFISNQFFYQSSGYFAPAAESQILLHTWSLAVEWQFYIIFPFAVMAVKKVFSYRLILGLLFFLGLSFFYSCYLVVVEPSAAFYHLPSRAWELIAGGVIGVAHMNGRQCCIPPGWAISVGLLCIFFSALGFNSNMTFPGWGAAFPVLAAALVVYGVAANSNAAVNRLLAWPPLVHIGKLSYSIYLIHWPFLLYFEMYLGEDLNFTALVFCWIAVGLLAQISYILVESRFRYSGLGRGHLGAYLTTSVAAFLLASVGFLVYRSGGLPQRMPSEITAFLDVKKWGNFGECEADHGKDQFYNCRIGDLSAAETVLIWGDSHAQTLLGVFDKVGKDHGVAFRHVTKGGCPPLAGGVSRPTNIDVEICLKAQGIAMQLLRETKTIKHLIISARWSSHWPRLVSGPSYSYAKFPVVLRETLIAIANRGVKITLIANLPEPGFPVVESVGRSLMLGRSYVDSFRYDAGSSYQFLNEFSEKYNNVADSTLKCDTL